MIAITGQVKTHGDRIGRVPGDADRRGLPRHHQASLSGDRRRRPAAGHEGGFHIATTGRPGPVLIDMPKDVQDAKLDARLGRADGSAGLHDGRIATLPAEQIRQVAAAIQPRKRPVIYAGGGIIAGRRQRRAPRSWHSKTGIPGHHDRDGTGGISRATIRSVAGHARHARQRLLQLRDRRGRPAAGPGRAVRRSRDRQALGIRQARQDRARRHRRLGTEQEQGRPHPDLQRREVLPDRS